MTDKAAVVKCRKSHDRVSKTEEMGHTLQRTAKACTRLKKTFFVDRQAGKGYLETFFF